jgi:hypothetical protein
MLDGLYEERPPNKKGKHVISVDKKSKWKFYETTSALYNMLWGWTVDDSNNSVYLDRHDNEVYEGFELYIRIAHDIHSAIPKEQLNKPIFKKYKWKCDTYGVKQTIYSLMV